MICWPSVVLRRRRRPAAALCPTGAEQLLDQIDHVFIGDLVEVKGAGDDVGTAVIRVRENFKGELSGVVEVRDALADAVQLVGVRDGVAGPLRDLRQPRRGRAGRRPAFCPQTQPMSGWKDRAGAFSRLRPGAPTRPRRRAGPSAATPVAGPSSRAPKTGSWS